MWEWFKDWMNRANATTHCRVFPGDTVRVKVTSSIDRPCNKDGVILGWFHHDHVYEFEWTATRPYRTLEDAILAASATLDVVHVQTKDTI